jgi:WD40 repeat protein
MLRRMSAAAHRPRLGSRRVRGRRNRDYDAFVSYSHAVDGRLAPALQAALGSLGKRWNQRTALRVFRDQSSLAVSPSLWPAIERALSRSRYFILMASEESAASDWVDREVAWWREHRGADTLLVGLTGGELCWDRVANDFSSGSPVPASARGWLPDEPLWVDLRWAREEEHVAPRNPLFRDAAAALSAAIHGIDKDQLVGEDLRQHKRTVRLTRAAVGAISMLAVAASGLAVVALVQRGQARHEAKVARAQALAALGANQNDELSYVGLALGFEASNQNDSPEARRTMIGAMQSADPSALIAVLHGHAAGLSDVAYSRDASRIATASADKTARIWDAHTGRTLAVLRGHDDLLTCIAFSPDGDRLATGSFDDSTRIWDARTGRLLRVRRAGFDGVQAVAFSPSGATLAISSSWGDGGIRLLDVATGRVVARLKHRTPSVTRFSPEEATPTAVFSPDGRKIATTSGDGVARLWDARTGRSLASFSRGEQSGKTVAFSPNGALLATGGFDGVVRTWRVADATLVHTLRGHNRPIDSLMFSPDGTGLVVAAHGSAARFWNVRSGQREVLLRGTPEGSADVHVSSAAYSPDGGMLVFVQDDGTVRLISRSGQVALLEGHALGVSAVRFSHDGRTLVTAGRDGTARLWSVREALAHELIGHTGPVKDVAVSPDGRMIATAGVGGGQDVVVGDKTARIWNASTGRLARRPITFGDTVSAVAFSPDGALLAASSFDGTIQLVSVRTGKATSILRPRDGRVTTLDGRVTTVSFTPDGRTVVTGSEDGTARLWRTDTGREVAKLAHPRAVSDTAFSPDGKLLATGSGDSRARLWDPRDGRLIGTLRGHGASIGRVAFRPDSRVLATTSSDGTARLWDIDTRRTIAVLRGKGTSVTAVAFNPDGRTLATGDRDGHVMLWDARSGELEASLGGHTNNISALAFSPLGRVLASASDDDTIRLWDTPSGRAIGTLRGHRGSVRALAFSADGTTLVSGDNDRSARVWHNVSWRHPADMKARVCRVLSGGLSRAEWAQYAPGLPYRNSCR